MSLGYILTIATFSGIYAILVLGLNIVTGYAKQISLGHAAFAAIAAYAQALLTVRAGMSFWAALPITVLISMCIGGLLGLPSLRVSHDHLVLTTIGLNFIVMGVVEYFDFFGGAMGIIGLRMPTFFGRPLGTVGYFCLVLMFLLLALAVSYYFSRTWARLAMESLGEDELAASSLGVNVARFKIVAFVLSSAYTGLAGALWAHYVGSVFPKNFPFELSVLFLSMLVFGGMGTIRGAIFGAVILYILPELFRFVENYRMLVYGVLLTIMVTLQPQGILGVDGVVDRVVSKVSALVKRARSATEP